MRITRSAALAVVAALAVPAGASAASVSASATKLTSGQLLGLDANDGRGKPDSFNLIVTRGILPTAKRLPNQMDMFDFKRVNVVINGNRATIKGSLGARGSVNLRFTNPKLVRAKLPRGCTGKPARSYTGQFVGVLRFRTVDGRWNTIRRMPAEIYTGDATKLTCVGDSTAKGDGDGNGSGAGGEPRLALHRDLGNGNSWFFTATRSSLTFTRMLNIAVPKGSMHMTMITATGDALLNVTGGGAHATVRGAGAFTGGGTFTSAFASETVATGPLAPGLTVTGFGVPVVQLEGENAILTNPNG